MLVQARPEAGVPLELDRAQSRLAGVGWREVCVPGAADVLALVSRVYGLSARERELVRLLLTGLDTRELATRMFISRYTVNDHLKSVFAKLGIHSRRELVTGLFGQTA
jgi:DNA-binding CsgD family transcriptional regulator